MWIYEIISGKLSKDNATLATGYSGDPVHKNDPYAVNLKDEGPIPEGMFSIGAPINTADHGPEAMPLTPDPENEMYGRSGFMMHGDNVHTPGTASEGCIIMPKFARDFVVKGLTADNRLQVVAQIPIPELDQWNVT